MQEQIQKIDLEKLPLVIKNVVLMSQGIWNKTFFSKEEIQKAFDNTDWSAKERRHLFLDHQDSRAGEWIGEVDNINFNGDTLFGDLLISDPSWAAKLKYGKPKMGISPKVGGRLDESEKSLKSFTFENFSLVVNPAVKTAFINNMEDLEVKDSNSLKSDENFKKDLVASVLKELEGKVTEEEFAKITGFEADRKRRGMSPSQYYAVPRDPPSASKLPIPDACLSGDTQIPLLDGRNIPIKDLVGQEVWTYGYDLSSKVVVPVKAKNIRKTISNAEVIRVVLDNGENIVCTPNHRFLLRNELYMEAGSLAEGTSIMPLYREKKQKVDRTKSEERMAHYEWVYQPFYNFWELSHHMSYRGETGNYVEKGNVIHHKDDNHLNNKPDNLVQMSRSEHCSLHLKKLQSANKEFWDAQRCLALKKAHKYWEKPENRRRRREMMKKLNKANVGMKYAKSSLVWTVERRKAMSQKFKKLWKDPEYREKVMSKVQGKTKEKWKDLEYRKKVLRGIQTYYSKKKVGALNHKVVAIEFAGFADVYDMEIPRTNNFALAGGIFVHNSHVRNAMARFNQTQGLSPEEKATARRKIISAAKKFGIEVGAFDKGGGSMSDENKAELSKPEDIESLADLFELFELKGLKVTDVMNKAKELRDKEESWRSALKRASAILQEDAEKEKTEGEKTSESEKKPEESKKEESSSESTEKKEEETSSEGSSGESKEEMKEKLSELKKKVQTLSQEADEPNRTKFFKSNKIREITLEEADKAMIEYLKLFDDEVVQ